MDGIDVHSVGDWAASPVLSDVDGDGDLDLVVGNWDGQIRYFENTGSPQFPAFTERTGNLNPMDDIDVGSGAAPVLSDLDGDGDLSSWDVSRVTNMRGMFYGASTFNANLAAWDVAQVTDMRHMFSGASAFNADLSAWNVSRVFYMAYMFYGISAFNQDLSTWDVSRVTNMDYMFYGASAFNQSLSAWDVGRVTTMYGMFWSASAFNADLSTWNVARVTNMAYMFHSASAFNADLQFIQNGTSSTNWEPVSQNMSTLELVYANVTRYQDLSVWNVARVTSMRGMFYRASTFNGNLTAWNVTQVTDMQSMFYEAEAFNQDLSAWDVSRVTDMQSMFYGASQFDQNVVYWDVGQVINMASMFDGAGCPEGQFKNSTGACMNCNPGRYRGEEVNFCNTCGNFCRACPAGFGTYEDEGAGPELVRWQTYGCSDCTTDSYTELNDGICTECEAGKTLNSSKKCATCPRGYELRLPKIRTWTNPWAASGNQTMIDYIDQMRPTAFDRCAGPCENDSDCKSGLKCQKRFGSESVYGCDNKKGAFIYGGVDYGPKYGTNYCVHPDYGTGNYISVHPRNNFEPSDTTCSPCLPGFTSASASVSGCQACPGGYHYADNASAACKTCPDGYFSQHKFSTSCTVCPSGHGISTDKTNDFLHVRQCIECGPGKFSPINATDRHMKVCQSCAVGTFSNQSNVTQCKLCPVGYDAGNVSSVACDACKPGRYEPYIGSEACDLCSIGMYLTESAQTGPCKPCAFGRVAQPGQAECDVCGSAETHSQDYSVCRPVCYCEFGKPALECNSTQRHKCIKCIHTFGLNDDGICAICGANHRPSADGLQCAPCPAGMGSLAEKLCTRCPPGQTSVIHNNVSSGCYPMCGAGHYAQKISFRDYICVSCEPGKYSNTVGGLSCAECPKGYAQSAQSATECNVCGERGYSDSAGSVYCKACPNGTGIGQTAIDSREDCLDCVAHSEYDPDTFTCKPCSKGKYRSQTMTACNWCPLGTSSESGHACRPCPVGTYGEQEGACTPCLPGTTSIEGSTSFDNCSIVEAGSLVCSYYSDLDCDKLDVQFESDCTQTCGKNQNLSTVCTVLRSVFANKKCKNQRNYVNNETVF